MFHSSRPTAAFRPGLRHDRRHRHAPTNPRRSNNAHVANAHVGNARVRAGHRRGCRKVAVRLDGSDEVLARRIEATERSLDD
jgi:hypothetical protein